MGRQLYWRTGPSYLISQHRKLGGGEKQLNMRETGQESGGGGGDQIQKSEKDQVRRLSEMKWNNSTFFFFIDVISVGPAVVNHRRVR